MHTLARPMWPVHTVRTVALCNASSMPQCLLCVTVARHIASRVDARHIVARSVAKTRSCERYVGGACQPCEPCVQYVILSHVLHIQVYHWYCGYAYRGFPSIAHTIVLHILPKRQYCTYAIQYCIPGSGSDKMPGPLVYSGERYSQ